MKKMGLAAGQGIAYSLKIVCLFILSTNIAMAAQYVSHLGSRDAARSACLAETSALVNSYGGAPCRIDSYYGSRKFYFTFCSIGEYRTRCSYKSNYHKFTYPIPYEESVVDQYYETRQDLYSACSADLVAKTNSPKARCQGSGSWKDDQGRALGFTTQVTGYILYRHPQTTPSWIVYPCSSIYAWQGSITWCQQTNFRSYFEGCPAGTEADPANFNKCEPVADDPFKDNGSPCGNDQAASAGSRSGGKGSAGNMVGNPCHAGTGNKYEAETDFDGVPGLTRSYNSKGQRDVGFGMAATLIEKILNKQW